MLFNPCVHAKQTQVYMPQDTCSKAQDTVKLQVFTGQTYMPFSGTAASPAQPTDAQWPPAASLLTHHL